MNSRMKRGLALLLCLVMLATAVPAFSAQAEEIELIPFDEEDPGEEIVLIEEPAEPMGTKPTITTQPKSKTAELDETVKFTVEATGAETYQWYYRKSAAGEWLETALSGCTTATLKVAAKSTRDGWQFRCKVSNSSGYVYSGAATLTLKKETPTEKPVIVAQPASVSVKEETSAKFTVEASGAESYQWYYRKNSDASWAETTLSGCTTATLTVLAKSTRDGWQFRCKVSNRIGYVYTKAVTLTLLQKPAITAQPANRTVSEGDTAKFTVKATGAESYQWYWRSSSSGTWAKSSLTGNQTATLSVVGKTSRNGYQYRCRVSNGAGYVYTGAATLTVTAKPVITTQPSDRTVNQSDTAKFTVKATGATAYQWYYRKSSSGSWAKSTLTGAKTATLSVKGTAARNGYQYRCKVSNDYGYVYSKAATLTVNTLPVITKQPTDLTISAGGNAFFSLEATNADSYQWYWRKNSSSDWAECTVAGATTARLGYGSVGYSSDGYQYRCKVSNSIGYVYSDTVTLTVAHIQPEITTQPSSVTAEEGAAARFTVKATGGGLSYQWYWRSSSSSSWQESNATGFNTATLTYEKLYIAHDGRQFRCKVSNDVGTVYTNTVTLTVNKSAPKITSQPKSQTVSEGASATFTVEADYAESYQWYYRKSSEGSWAECTGDGSTSATLKFSKVSATVQYRCKVSNSAGYVYTDSVTLTVVPLPKITTQPKNLAINAGGTATFSVVADNVASYQWYWRPDESTDWIGLSGNAASISFSNVDASWNGRQFRCMLTNSAGGSKYTDYGTLVINNSVVRYRALLIGEVKFCVEESALRNKQNVILMANMLENDVKGPTGGSYSVTKKYNLTTAQIKAAIKRTFQEADENDVSLFYIATHGKVDRDDEWAGALLVPGADGVHDYFIQLEDLAEWLNDVPGTVIVFLASCGSGAAIYSNDGSAASLDPEEAAERFNQAAIRAFAAADERNLAQNGAVSNLGEFRTNKFYVMTAAAHKESGWGIEPNYNYFTYFITLGAGSGKPADNNKNGTITLNELYSYVYQKVCDEAPFYDEGDPTPHYQHVQVYPENSSYALFK